MGQLPEYRLVHLPDGIPSCLDPQSAASSETSSFIFGNESSKSESAPRKAREASAARGFDPTRALRGAAPSKHENDESESACKSRGDGLFDGGTAFRREGNKVIMAPGAFSEENAMKTLEELDRQQLMGRQKEPPAPEKHGKLLAEKNLSSLDKREVEGIFDLLNMVTPSNDTLTSSRTDSLDDGNLFDVRDSYDSTKRRHSTATAASEGRTVAETPKWTVTQKISTSKCPCAHLQMDVELPSIESIQEVDLMVGETVVRLKAGAVYNLEAELPTRVSEEKSVAKWSKAAKRLTLLLPVV